MHRPTALVLLLALATAASASPADDRARCAGTPGDQAIAACSRLIAGGKLRGRDVAVAYSKRCISWNQKREYERALADCNEAIRVHRSFAPGYTNRCWVLNNMGEHDRAMADCNEAIRLNPADTAPFLNRGIAWAGKGDFDRAIADYDRVLGLDPKNAKAFGNRGRAWAGKRDYDRASADFEQALRLDPKTAFYLNGRGLVKANKRDYAGAMADYNEAIRLDPKFVVAYNNRALVFKHTGDYDRALADLDQAIRLDPKYVHAYANRGLVWTDKGDVDRAIAEFDQAIRVDPGYTAALTNRGLAYERKGDRERAHADFQAALALPQKYENGKWAHTMARERLAAQAAQAPTSPLSYLYGSAASSAHHAPTLGTTSGNSAKLSQNEIDALRARLMSLWNPPAGARTPEELLVRVRIQLGRDGNLSAPPIVLTSGHSPLFHAARESAVRAVFRGQPYDMLSQGTYEAWKDMEITFDPRTTTPLGSAESSAPATPATPPAAAQSVPLPRPPGQTASSSGAQVALLIANDEYPDADQPLQQPRNDARLLAGELRARGFDVDVAENLTRLQMREVTDRFIAKVNPGSVALIYYSGYCIQSRQTNYMIPVNAQIWSEQDVSRNGISIESILADIPEGTKVVKLVIVDASRRNPFERRFRRAPAGLAPIVAPNNTLLISAGGLGQLVNEGTNKNSLFITELMREFRTPEVGLEDVFSRARIGVSRATDGDQVPWVSSTLVQSVSLKPAEGRGGQR